MSATIQTLIDRLINKTSEDAVFCFISAISCFGIESREDAIIAAEKDQAVRRWLQQTNAKIP